MIKIQVQGKTMQEIRAELIRAANEISDGSEPAAKQVEFAKETAKILEEVPEVKQVEKLNKPQFPIDMPKAAAQTAEDIASPTHDKRGIPYDSRIHSSSRSFKADGTWRMKKGAEPELVAQVEAETRVEFPKQVVQGSPLPTSQPVIPPAPVSEVKVEIPKSSAPPLAAAQTPLVEQIAPPATKEFRPAAHTFDTFKTNFAMVLHDLVKFEKIDQNWINEMKKHYKVEEVWNLIGDDKALRQLYDHFGHYGMITKMDTTVRM